MNKNQFCFAVVLTLFVGLFSSCGTGSGEEYEKVRTENDELKAKIQKDSSYLVQMNSEMQELYSNLDSMRAREERIRQTASRMQGGQLSGEGSASIDRAFADMEKLNAENQQKIAALQAKLKASGNNNALLKRTLDELEKQIADKNTQINDLQATVAALQGELDEAKKNIATTTTKLQETEAVVVERENKIAEAFYTIGSRKDLEKSGVITAKGLFNKNKDLAGDIDEAKFTKVDSRNVNEIEIGDHKAKRIELVPARSASSYQLVENGKSTTLKISDPASFWRTKYVVIVVK
jgi:chromosome segregation ATPase